MPKMNLQIDDHSPEVLKALGEKIEMAMETCGAQAATYAIKDTPVDSGALRNSITWATIKDKGGGSRGGGQDKPKEKPEKNSVYIGSNISYAVYQEYGDYNHKVGKKHFLRDAVANHKDHYKAIIEAALKS